MVRVMVIGAHPDDCEVYAGGAALLWRARGDAVCFVSTTNGDAGHHALGREELARRRIEETKAVAALADVDYEVLDCHDGMLEPTLARRLEIIRLIRRYAPDLVLTHRPNDYHPDHRYTSMLVQDAAYMVTVPPVCPNTPHLARNPVFGYLWDPFTKPNPFEAHVVVDIDGVVEKKLDLLDAHVSQFYEWLPFNDGVTETVPDGAAERRRWLGERWSPYFENVASQHRDALAKSYDATRAERVRYAEAFEIGEYGSRPDAAELRRLFPLD